MTVRRRRSPSVNGLLITLAVLFGLVSLFYPFGADQALFYYTGREWLHGSIPYRDVLEQKTPLIFALHALLIILTGHNMWAIRLAELIWVVGLGWVIAALATPRGEPTPDGVRGTSTLALSILYYGFFGHCNTAQCEIWYAGLILCSLFLIERPAADPGRISAAGVLAGLAILMKPPAAMLIPVLALAAATRAWQDAGCEGQWRASVARSVVRFGIGTALPIILTLGYFQYAGALEDLIDVVVRANYYFMLKYDRFTGVEEVTRLTGRFVSGIGILFGVAVTLVVGFLAIAVRRRAYESGRRYVLATLLLAGSVAAVYIQRKLYGYHWGVLFPMLALPFGCAAFDLSADWVRWPAGCLQRLRPWSIAVLIVAGYLASTPALFRYAHRIEMTARFLAGNVDRERYLAAFACGATRFVDQEAVGTWIAQHSDPGDFIAVRGFEQVVYAVADRRAPTRFFCTEWLSDPRLLYRRAEWLGQDREALRRNPPRYIVVAAHAMPGPDSVEYFAPLIYAERYRHGPLIVLERVGSSAGGVAPE